jgi:LacI family transcriptional regulator
MVRHVERAVGGNDLSRSARAVTIYDIAREAGVAASTVSRALTHPQRVNNRTREHIEQVADRLGYRPNPIARALPSGRTQTVALLVSDITNPHFFDVIRGAERGTTAAGYTLILANSEESGEAEQRHVERLARGVDGFVLAASRLPDRRIRDLAAELPVTLVNRKVGGVASAVIDQRDGTRQIVEHLVGLGHTSIAFLAGPQASWMAAQRWRALSAAARRLRTTAVRLGPFAPTVEGGTAAADAALDAKVTAVVAHNDLLAIGVLRRFAQRGTDVPGDVSVVGYDDIFGADFCSPSLTTLAGPLDEAGSVAMEVLLDLIAARDGSGPRRDVVLPSHLVVRESTGPSPA